MFQTAELNRWGALSDEVGVLTFYTTLEPGTSAAPVRFRNQVAALDRALDDTLDKEKADLVHARIATLADDFADLLDPAREGLGRMLFAQVAGDAVDTAWVQMAIGNHTLFGPRTHLWPLVVATSGAEPAGVVRVGRDGVRLFDLRYGLAEELEPVVFSLEGADWARTGAATLPAYSRRGIHPDRFEQRVEEHLAKYLRQSAPIVDRAARRRGWTTLLLAGAPRLTAGLAADLATHIPTSEVDAVLDPYLSPTEVMAWAAPLLKEVRAQSDRRAVADALDRAHSGGNAVLGFGEILSLLDQGRVEQLLIGPDGAWKTTTPTGTEEELIHHALTNGSDFALVKGEAARLLDKEAGGLAAVLRW